MPKPQKGSTSILRLPGCFADIGEQFVHVRRVLVGVVQEKLQFGHDPGLVPDALTQFVAYFGSPCPYLFQIVPGGLGVQKTEMRPRDGQVGRHPDGRHGDESARCPHASLPLEKFRQVLPDDGGKPLLSLALCGHCCCALTAEDRD